MPATVLGKRTRSAVERTETSASTRTRAKRTALLIPDNDENENPFVTRRKDGGCEDGSTMEIDELASSPKKGQSIARTAPVDHDEPAQRLPLSSSKLLKATNPVVEVYQDGGDGPQPTPKTPRHRDVLAPKVAITPRHRVLLTNGQHTPRTPNTPSSASLAIYTQARQLFSRCTNPGRLVGRDEERRELSNFIESRITSKSGGCLYLSGPPGTGKSALVDEVCQLYRDRQSLTMSTVNCMSVKNAKDLAGKLSEDLGLEEDAGFEYLQACFIGKKAKKALKHMVILDEVDRLVDLDLALLYSLFEWSMQPSSRLVLVGIANALDLTDRFLPRLKARNFKPELLPFMPYTAAQIAEVITTKLKTLCASAEGVPFLQPPAIQFCAQKVAAQTGDLRKAFDICRRAIELVEQETREKQGELALQQSPSKLPLMENVNLSSPPTPRSLGKSPRKQKASLPITVYTLETAPKANIAHMAKVTAQAFGNGTTQRLAALSLQQKAVLCALAALEERRLHASSASIFATPSKTAGIASTVKQLFEAYTSLCKRKDLLHPLSSVEFRDVVSGLETQSLVAPAKGKNGSFAVPLTPSRTPSRRGRGGFGAAMSGDERRIASAVGHKELSAALAGSGSDILREMLEGNGLY